MSLNLHKKAAVYLTPRGQKFLDELQQGLAVGDSDENASIQRLLSLFEDGRSFELGELVDAMGDVGYGEISFELIHDAHMKGLLTSTEEGAQPEFLPDYPPMEEFSSKLGMKKTAAMTYVSELLSVMTEGLERVSANYTASGAEAIVTFQSSEGGEPQQYHIVITPHRTPEEPPEGIQAEEGSPWGPQGPPPWMRDAFKLNMKKTSLEIGGVEFPDETYDESHNATMYKEAENFIINYIWRGLYERGITGPDDANVIQEDADKIRFSDASTLVRRFLDEGFSAYINQSDNPVLKESAELRQSLYNAIKNAVFFEGEV